MLDTKGYRHTLRICNTYCFSTATVVTRKRFKITFLSLSSYPPEYQVSLRVTNVLNLLSTFIFFALMLIAMCLDREASLFFTITTEILMPQNTVMHMSFRTAVLS